MSTGTPISPSTAESPSNEALERELGGRYRLIAAIGKGASATVFLAEDTSLRRQVAVKVLHDALATDTAFRERFQSEARSAASLSHPNIMAVHDWGQDEVPFLVMEYLGGGSLRAMLDAGSTLTPSQAITIGLEACRGLHFAHEQSLVHRDIKPANMLFGHEGRLRIADFGLARALADAGWTEPGQLVGTARYASPEQAQGNRLTPQSDVYSLGLTLIEALTGEVPFASDTTFGTLMARVDNDVPIPDVPERLADALRAMTNRSPDERSTSPQAGMALLHAAEGLPRPKPLALAGAINEPITLDEPDAATVHVVADATEVAGTPTVERVDDDGPTRRWPWMMLTLIAIAIGGWFAYNQVEASLPAEFDVPDVVGMARDEAVIELGDKWVLVEKFDRVADVEKGSIIRTDPAAGETLTEGDELSYWISLGLPLIRVPESELLGRSLEQARATIDAEGLTVGRVTRVSSEDIGEGLVISIGVSAAELPQGDPVDLEVSSGPVTRIVPEPEPGATVDAYIVTLNELLLGPNLTDQWDPDVPEGDFISIDPPPGTRIERGGQVQLIVSLGPEPVPVPETSGIELGEVLARLEADGFLAGELLGSGDARCPVVGTDPPAGTLIQPGNPVTIFLSEC